jgi:hypothetical protein
MKVLLCNTLHLHMCIPILKYTSTSVLTKHRESEQYIPLTSCQHPHSPPHLTQLFKSWGINLKLHKVCITFKSAIRYTQPFTAQFYRLSYT